TGQLAQTLLAWLICVVDTPREEIGKNRSGSADRQAPRLRQSWCSAIVIKVLGCAYRLTRRRADRSRLHCPAGPGLLTRPGSFPAGRTVDHMRPGLAGHVG